MKAERGCRKNSNTESGKRNGKSIITTTMVMNTPMRMSGGMMMVMAMVTVIMMTSLRTENIYKSALSVDS